jgi:hypothetical protein
MLRRRAAVLESGVHMREQTLQRLLKTRQAAAKGQPQAPPQQQQQQEQQQQQPEEGGSGPAQQSQACAGSSGAPCAAASRHPLHSWTSYEQFPDPEVEEWDAELCAAAREMSPPQTMGLWVSFVKEASMLAFSVQVHGPE